MQNARRKRKVVGLEKAEEWYDRLVRPVEGQMIRSVLRVLRDPDDADDALQEALTMICKRLKRIKCHPNPQALILRICIDAAHDRMRRKLHQRRHRSLEPVCDQTVDPAPGTVERISRQEVRAEVLRAIGRLPRRQATAFLLRVVEEQSYRSIAQALGCRENTARTHVIRARDALKNMLAGLGRSWEQEVMQ